MNSKSTKTVQLLYFSSISEVTRKPTETLSTNAQSINELWSDLKKIYAIEINNSHIRPSINHRFCQWNDSLKDGDIVSFIPPVSGG